MITFGTKTYYYAFGRLVLRIYLFPIPPGLVPEAARQVEEQIEALGITPDATVLASNAFGLHFEVSYHVPIGSDQLVDILSNLVANNWKNKS